MRIFVDEVVINSLEEALHTVSNVYSDLISQLGVLDDSYTTVVTNNYLARIQLILWEISSRIADPILGSRVLSASDDFMSVCLGAVNNPKCIVAVDKAAWEDAFRKARISMKELIDILSSIAGKEG